MMHVFTPICLVLLLFVRLTNGHIVELNVNNFEHDTQATTGATTGHWLVCLTGCNKHHELLDRLSDDEEVQDMGIIVAQLKWNRKMGIRFDYTPSSRSRNNNGLIALFKQGNMYYYKVVSSKDIDEQIHHCKDFLHDQSGSETRVTPPEPGSMDTWGGLVTELIEFYKKLHGPQLQLFHAAGAILMAFCIFVIFYANSTAAISSAETMKKKQ